MNKLSFRQFLEQNTVGTHNDGPGGPFSKFGGAYMSSDQTGSEAVSTMGQDQRGSHLPSTDLAGINLPAAIDKVRMPSLNFSVPGDIPLVKIKSEVAVVNKNENPIFIQLRDGTHFYLSRDEYDRFGKPKEGMTVTAEFQRHPGDRSNNPSQVYSVKIG